MKREVSAKLESTVGAVGLLPWYRLLPPREIVKQQDSSNDAQSMLGLDTPFHETR